MSDILTRVGVIRWFYDDGQLYQEYFINSDKVEGEFTQNFISTSKSGYCNFCIKTTYINGILPK